MKAKSLFASIRCIKSIQIEDRKDFGKGCHTVSTEPYFYDAAYQPVKRDSPLCINENGCCIVAEKITSEADKGAENTAIQSKKDSEKWKKWGCTKECKPASEAEAEAILSLRAAFELPVESVRRALDKCDRGCPYGHYSKQVNLTAVPLKGHPIVCYNNSECFSKLRILRAVSTHFPVLRNLLRQIEIAISCHQCISEIDQCLSAGEFRKLMDIINVKKIESLISNNLDSRYEQVTEAQYALLRQPDLEVKLLFNHAALIAQLEKEINDFPEYVCCCCEHLHQRKTISIISISDYFNNNV